MKLSAHALLLILRFLVALSWTLSLSAQTVTWDRQALGQKNFCPGSGIEYDWPDNNNWSQTMAQGYPCAPGQLLTLQPSNWSTPNPPTNSTDNVVLGSQGGPANLDLPVVINSLTIQAGGALSIQAGALIGANAYDFQADGGITQGGGGGTIPALVLFSGGTMTKSSGSGTFTIDPGVAAVVTNATFVVASGTLALPGANSSYFGGGSFNVTAGATLNLLPDNQDVNFSGTFNSTSLGTVLLGTGRLHADSGGLTLNLPGSQFQWTGGSIQVSGNAPFTNTGTMTLSGGNVSGINFYDAGTMIQTGGGGLNIQGSSGINILSNGLFDLRNDAPITSNSGGGANPFINNYGLFRKSAGTNISVIHPNFDSLNSTIEVDSGTLMLTGSGANSCSNATLIVSNTATLDVTGGNHSTWSGLINGSGSGQVLLAGGNLSAGAGGLTLNLPGSMFQWTGGDFQVSDSMSAPFTNIGMMTISGGRVVGGSFFNAGTMLQPSAGGLTIHGSLNNLPGGLFDIQNDAAITTDVGGSINNYGSFRKSAGTNSAIEINFNNQAGTIEVDNGTLSLAGGGISSNATLIVSKAAVLDLTGGNNPSWSGFMNGGGAGQVLLEWGTVSVGTGGLVLNLPGSLFQWIGGSLDASFNACTNVASMAVSGGDLIGANFWNTGTISQTGTNGYNIEAGAGMYNAPGGLVDLQNDAPVTANGGGGQGPFIVNYGVFRKSAGTSNSVVFPNLNTQGGTVEVDSGTLTLANNGTCSNATLVVSNAATLDLTGGANPTWSGLIRGQGAGQVLLQSGTLQIAAGGLTANLPGSLFQWVGGTIQDGTSAPFTNAGTMIVSGGTAAGPSFFNAGTIIQSGTAGLNIHNNSAVFNLIGSLIDLQNDAAITAFGGGGNSGGIINYGLFRKSGGTSNSIVNPYFNNLSGTIEVDSGTLALAGNGTTSNATLIVKSGAVLDITGGANPAWSGLVTGTGPGQVLLQSGTLHTGAGGVTVNLPDPVFQWTGGQIQVSDSAPFTNAGTLNVSGGMVGGNTFFNAGTMLLVGTNGLDNHGRINNLPGAVFDLQSDAPIAEGSINNYGLLRKSMGTNVSVISDVNNQNGDIEVDSGTISLTGGFPDNYVQGSGAFTVKLGGTNSGQFGQLQCNNATLSGPLNVSISSNFAPARGNQFPILSSSTLSGTFNTLNVPQGISVLYTNNSVILVVTNAVPAQLTSPAISKGNFGFSLQTVSGQSYTILHNDDLATTNWVFYTNLVGNGSVMQVLSPLNNIPNRFFRALQP